MAEVTNFKEKVEGTSLADIAKKLQEAGFSGVAATKRTVTVDVNTVSLNSSKTASLSGFTGVAVLFFAFLQMKLS